jgi:hypothetical protein
VKSHEIIEESMAVNRYHVWFLVAFQQTLALHIWGLKKRFQGPHKNRKHDWSIIVRLAVLS